MKASNSKSDPSTPPQLVVHPSAEIAQESATTEPVLITVHDVAKMLSCSARTVHRLVDGGHMPAPIKLNTLIRWPRHAIESWIAAGCPKVRKGVRR